jgi:hypothetical protein
MNVSTIRSSVIQIVAGACSRKRMKAGAGEPDEDS